MTLTEIPYKQDSRYWFEKIRHLSCPVFLHSADAQGVDIISAAPSVYVSTKGGTTQISSVTGTRCSSDDPFSLLDSLLANFKQAELPETTHIPRFKGGILGYFGYDLGRRIESLPSKAQADIRLPDMAAGIYLWCLETNHSLQKTLLFIHPDCPELLAEELLNLINAPLQTGPTQSFKLASQLRSNFTPESYRNAFQTIKQYIESGDCYQVNLAQRFTAEFSGDSWELYHRTSEQMQAPFSAYLASDGWSVLSFSPERFLAVKDRAVTAQPIKGTRPRSEDTLEDQQLARELCQSSKDRAENLMIVDLLRNDLGKSCSTGTVKTTALFRLEHFRNVHHLVSDITGHLADAKSVTDLLRGCFPGGSITGAPKIRAMEIIDELEPHRRSMYCGSIGYIDFSGAMDMNIAIRTLVCDLDSIHCWGGGGIVADSDWEQEYQESLDKINLLLQSMQTT